MVAQVPTYIFAGGGTGGHLCPGIAVARELTDRLPEARVLFACSQRPIDRLLLGELEYGAVTQPVVPLPRSLGGWGRFLRRWRSSRALARDMLRDLRPTAVLGLGGFAAGPMVREAASRGVRCALLNPDAVPGKANRYLSHRADVVFTQFAESLACFPAAVQSRVRRVGCPVRMAATARQDETYAHFGLDPQRKTLLVLGGSLGAANINRALQKLSDDLDQRARGWQILHLFGPGQAPLEAKHIHVAGMEFCRRMDLALALADLAICRGGASSLAELTATATPAIILPYPYHRDAHQKHNAEALAAWGAAVVCEDRIDPKATAALLWEHLRPILDDPSLLARMTQDARRQSKDRAAEAVAHWLVAGDMPPRLSGRSSRATQSGQE
jgi:UDP-N-acetylglucosamine--N-acetylmuramyl-(pentapeptide) pyrophosphoryl-undecaprenol N-acetylglucosamine transferase